MVAYPSGNRACANVTSGNLHSAELLPNGDIAIATSGGGFVWAYASSQGASASTHAQDSLTQAYAALWARSLRRPFLSRCDGYPHRAA